MAALGEIAHDDAQLDDLFVRHTYLGAVIAMAVQASFGIDIKQLAETAPVDLLQGNEFHSKTGLQGIIQSDFFTWPTEFREEGIPLIKTLARSIARFDWQKAPTNVAAILYETVIPREGAPPAGGVLHPCLAGRDDGARVGDGSTEPEGSRSCLWLRYIRRRGRFSLHRSYPKHADAPSGTVEQTPGSGHWHRRPSCRRPPGPLCLGSGRQTCH